MKRLAFAVLFLVFGASGASAQWDTPSFLAPTQGNDIGVYFVQPDGTDWGLVGIWRQAGNMNLGIRGGVADSGDDTYGIIGAEFFGNVMRGNAELPLINIIWTAGAGAAFGPSTIISVPVGLSIGAALDAGAILLIPYLHPRVALDFASGDGDTEVDLALPIDLGADVRLANGVIIRVGGTLSDHEGVGVGLAFPFGRRVSVR